MKNANKLVTNDIKVFIAAFCQQSVSRDKCERNQQNKRTKFVSARRSFSLVQDRLYEVAAATAPQNIRAANASRIRLWP
jgi:hypothetical protein